MGGGLMQLVAYGAQDIYLTGNPQITFFKVVYRRHTNFAMEAIEQTFNGSANFNSKVSCTVSRNGDLVHRMYLEVVLTNSNGTVTPVACEWGNALVKSVEVEVGGQRVDKQYGEWMNMWNDLSLPSGQASGYAKMIASGSAATNRTVTNGEANRLYVPLQFWFCRNPGLALPLIALQYHEVKVNVEFNASSKIASANAPAMTSASLYVDYIYLDTDERRRFAQVSHEYLIEQVQHTGVEALSASANKLRLNFNHPVKELVWGTEGATFGAWQSSTTNAKLQLNGHDRFAQRDGDYFRLVQPYQHHTNCPSGAVYVYSFALRPEEHQPSGTCNFSRIDNATLNMTSSAAANCWVFAVNYNVLRVMSGMGGLAYSN